MSLHRARRRLGAAVAALFPAALPAVVVPAVLLLALFLLPAPPTGAWASWTRRSPAARPGPRTGR